MSRKWTWFGLFVLGGATVSLAYAASAQGDRQGNDRVLSKVTFIHYKKGHAKPPWAGGGGGKGDKGSYTYIANGARWRTIEDVRLNLSCGENVGGSLDALIEGAFLAGMAEWETPGSSTFDVFGGLVLDPTVSYDDGAFRGYNTISFGPYGDPGVIAVTSVWGYFSGPPSQREIVESHILMNDAFQWGDAGIDAALMDIQNIATHELGHWAGMGDLYDAVALEETMYGYSTEGEIKKRDLYKGDIAGVTKLYQ